MITFNLNKIRANSLLRIMILCILVFCYTLANNGLSEEKENRDVLVAEHQLKELVLSANLALRNAVIAHDLQEITIELNKLTETRSKGDKIYKYLGSTYADLKKQEQSILKELIEDRPIYRSVQNSMVEAARADNDQLFWEKHPVYKAQMDHYLSNVDLLISSTTIRTAEEHQKHNAQILLSLVFGITFTTFALWKVLV